MSKDDEESNSKRSILHGLTEQEVAVLKQRFGIDVNDPSTWQENELQSDDVREKIRKIEAKALRKLGNRGSDDAV